MLYVGFVNSYGVYLEEYRHHVFKETPSSLLSWIGCLQIGALSIFSAAFGILAERFDSRLVGLLGSLLAGAGLLLASACTTPIGLLFTQGIMFGAGGSCLMMLSMSLPSQWMVKHRATAMGIVTTGSSVGGLWLSFATRGIMTRLSWQWSLRFGGLLLIGLGGPISLVMRKRVLVQADDKAVDTTAFKNTGFMLLFCFSMFAVGGCYIPYYFMPSYSVVVLNRPQAWSAIISSIISGSSIAGRLLTGVIAGRVGPLNALWLCSAGCTLLVLTLWLPFQNIGALISMALLYGVTSGCTISLLPVVTSGFFEAKRLPSIFGLTFFAYGAGTVLSLPVGGALLDRYGDGTNYLPVILFGGAFLVAATVVLSALRLVLLRSLLTKV
ncbi:hypothetical protein GGI04_000203 [Coemansia thaxteri]|nr:hypothetical protein GGI04_000203 [Coemansia thaxteri]